MTGKADSTTAFFHTCPDEVCRCFPDWTTKARPLSKDEYLEWCHEAIRQVVAERNAAEAERDRYRAALRRYGRHDLACRTQIRFTTPADCDCGFNDAVTQNGSSHQEDS